MYKIITVVGARPQFIKAAAINRAFRTKYSHTVKEMILHTGQHYDDNMSEVFFRELEIEAPSFRLEVGSASHGKQTGEMLAGIEAILLEEKPDALIVYGDTNSTLAGAIAASKIHIPVCHIEAGLRSFNKAMPEELNRVVTDHVSTLLFSPTSTGYHNLRAEGFKEANAGPYSADNPKIYHCGDIMYDNSLYFAKTAAFNTNIIEREGLDSLQYILATIHRNTNTDEPKRFISIIEGLMQLSEESNLTILAPLHPRTTKMMERMNHPSVEKFRIHPLVKIMPPASFLEMCLLESKAELIVTDSGGVQKESYFFKKPCVVLRSETEWVELMQQGSGILADADSTKIVEGGLGLLEKRHSIRYPDIFGDGHAAEFICTEIYKFLQGRA